MNKQIRIYIYMYTYIRTYTCTYKLVTFSVSLFHDNRKTIFPETVSKTV